jgi:hypothetical protein
LVLVAERVTSRQSSTEGGQLTWAVPVLHRKLQLSASSGVVGEWDAERTEQTKNVGVFRGGEAVAEPKFPVEGGACRSA